MHLYGSLRFRPRRRVPLGGAALTRAVAAQDARLHERGGHGDAVEQTAITGGGGGPGPRDQNLDSALWGGGGRGGAAETPDPNAGTPTTPLEPPQRLRPPPSVHNCRPKCWDPHKPTGPPTQNAGTPPKCRDPPPELRPPTQIPAPPQPHWTPPQMLGPPPNAKTPSQC